MVERDFPELGAFGYLLKPCVAEEVQAVEGQVRGPRLPHGRGVAALDVEGRLARAEVPGDVPAGRAVPAED